MMPITVVFLLLLLAFDFSNGSSHIVDECLDSCRDFTVPGNIAFCQQCLNDAPLSELVCEFACQNAIRMWKMVEICRNCFAEIDVMQNVCIGNCGITFINENSVLCRQCRRHGFD